MRRVGLRGRHRVKREVSETKGEIGDSEGGSD
jgi:hypothetical protein